jgi:hypothetical protein
LAGYTYLEREVDAKFYSQSQLRLVSNGDAQAQQNGDATKPSTGTSG